MNSVKTVFLLLTVFSSGCGIHKAHQPTDNYYYLNPNKHLTAIGRTALVELTNDSAFQKISPDVTEALFQALQKKQVFGLTFVHQNDPLWQNLQLDVNKAYTLEQLSAMRKAFNCDAVLSGTITGFEPFPHLTIGLRLKLIDLTDGQLLWALEQVWDTTDEITLERIRKYYNRREFLSSATLDEKLVTVSSLKFFKFIASETAETLQPER